MLALLTYQYFICTSRIKDVIEGVHAKKKLCSWPEKEAVVGD